MSTTSQVQCKNSVREKYRMYFATLVNEALPAEMISIHSEVLSFAVVVKHFVRPDSQHARMILFDVDARLGVCREAPVAVLHQLQVEGINNY